MQSVSDLIGAIHFLLRSERDDRVELRGFVCGQLAEDEAGGERAAEGEQHRRERELHLRAERIDDRRSAQAASTTPIAPPIADTTSASIRNCCRMLRVRAPVAMRMPISRVRSVTVTSMMFITPMPPTSSEIAAIEPEQDRQRVLRFGGGLDDRRHVADLEVDGAVAFERAASRPRPACRRCASTSSTATVTCAGSAGRTAAAGWSRSGTNTTSSWSCPLGDAPLRRHHADDLEHQVVDQHVLAERVLAVREQRLGDRLPEHRDRCVVALVLFAEEDAARDRPLRAPAETSPTCR